ncbi:MAG: low molecular weight phosphotyrosine protein phosphatase [Chloroflexi bacterium]|nr:MAG: low molecular weight phosphotyrosine protein phosphatase [Chloroflexota bacterium]
MIKVLFVCMGNICRSPMAEAVFRHLVEEAGLSDHFDIDSAGTISYHAGEPAHPGTQRVLAAHGIRCDSVARKVTPSDLREADYIIALDAENYRDLQAMAGRQNLDGRLHRLLDFAAGVPVRDVPDPYYRDNFEEVYRLVEAGCRGLLDHIRQVHGI